MPRLRLDDGVVIDLPDDASPTEIAEIVSAYYRPAKPQEGPPSAEAIDDLAETAPDAPPGPQTPSDMPSDPASDPASAETRPPRVRIEAYQNDPNDPGNVPRVHASNRSDSRARPTTTHLGLEMGAYISADKALKLPNLA